MCTIAYGENDYADFSLVERSPFADVSVKAAHRGK